MQLPYLMEMLKALNTYQFFQPLHILFDGCQVRLMRYQENEV